MRLNQSRDELMSIIVAEGGKPVRWARAEVDRAVATFRLAPEEARRRVGELQRLDTEPSSEGRMALNRRISRGPVLGITPFNCPLNLAAHKVAPRAGRRRTDRAQASASHTLVRAVPRRPTR